MNLHLSRNAPPVRAAAIMPVFGKAMLTAAALADLVAQSVPIDIWVVDNRGDYRQTGSEQVIRPNTNLGWLGGTNAGIAAAREAGAYTHLLLVNNDVRLTGDLVQGLLSARADLAAPTYDGFWNHQHTRAPSGVVNYRGVGLRWRAPFVDGTCLLVTTALLDLIGCLDPVFEPYGWGAELDLGIKANQAGRRVVITDAAFVEHVGEATAAGVHGAGYGLRARAHMYAVLNSRYGVHWDRQLGISSDTNNTKYVGRRRRLQETAHLAVKRRNPR
jgi:GT2 family glycosyltransferase